ncbi:MAG: cell wall hydrolase [Rhizobiales bacterium]|nr:cell wall hydrolase [Hyphomicrobiales bacterium]
MAYRYNHYTDQNIKFHQGQINTKTMSGFRHRIALHWFVGLVAFGVFFSVFNGLERNAGHYINAEINARYVETAVVLKQHRGASQYDIEPIAPLKKSKEVVLNSFTKRDSTIFTKSMRRNIGAEEFDIQPRADDLVGTKITTPSILSEADIALLKLTKKNTIEMNLPELAAPMPIIHSGEFDVDNMLALVTAKAHETDPTKPLIIDIRMQTKPLDKLNGFTIVKGKIASKTYKLDSADILLASRSVTKPIKRPKYTQKAKPVINISGRGSLTCLTTALYHEVRGESRSGQLAVAEVILSRKRSRSYPNSYCGVIYQNATKRNACQFSFACDGKSDLPRDLKTWKKLKKLAADFLAGKARLPSVKGATHYHADYVSPKWRWAMNRVARIGTHIFYKDPKVRI